MISIQREREGAPLIGLPFAACNEARASAAFSGGDWTKNQTDWVEQRREP